MPDIGPINVDYRSPKITDDLIQIGAGVQSAQRENLLSQIEARTLTTQMGAANTASQIVARDAATGVAQAKAENLINMNRAASRREDEKLPYVLDGLAAKNWIDQTVARNNELKNELTDLTMMDQVEQEAIQTETQYENLQTNRMKNEVARKEQESYSLNLPAYENFWSGVENGTIDPDTAPRPPYGGNGRLNDLHQQRINSWRDSSTGRAMETKAVETARDEAEARAEMSGPQIAAIDIAPKEDKNKLRQQARETNKLYKDLRAVNPGEAGAVITALQDNKDPVTNNPSGTWTRPSPLPGMPPRLTPVFSDANGNLTRHGKQAAVDAMKRLAASAKTTALAPQSMALTGKDAIEFKSQARLVGVRVDLEQVDTNNDGVPDEWRPANQDQVDEARRRINAAGMANRSFEVAKSERRRVDSWAKVLMEEENPNAEANELGEKRNYTPEEARMEARKIIEEGDASRPSVGPSTAGATPKTTAAPVGTPAQQTVQQAAREKGITVRTELKERAATPGPNQEAGQEAFDDLDRSTAKMHALDRLMRGKQEKEGPGGSYVFGDYFDKAWTKRGQTEGYSHATGKSTVPINEQDIDWVKFDDRGADGKFVGHAEFGDWWNPDDENSFDKAITKEMAKIVKQVGGVDQVWTVFKPHPYAIRQFGVKVPDLQSFDSNGQPPRQMPVRVYINDTNRPVGARWAFAPSRDDSSAQYTVKEMKDKLMQQLGVSYGSILMEGVDFEKGTGAPLIAKTAKTWMTWDQYRKKAALKE